VQDNSNSKNGKVLELRRLYDFFTDD